MDDNLGVGGEGHGGLGEKAFNQNLKVAELSDCVVTVNWDNSQVLLFHSP